MICYFLLINLVSFYLCYCDKKRAVAHRYRISESMLLFVSFVGGALGFLFAMYLFHHKTRKFKFLILEPLFLVLWILLGGVL